MLGFPERVSQYADAIKIKQAFWQLVCELKVAAPGIVTAFDAVRQTATVQLAIRENMNVPTPANGRIIPVPTPQTVAPLQNVPVVFPRGGGFSVTFPIAVGDECLVVFCDSCFDAWFQSGNVQNQLERRRHDLSDAIAIFGVGSTPRALSSYSASSLQIRSNDGHQLIELQSGEINITSTATVNLSAPQVNISGGNCSIESKDFLTHEHTGVSTGSGYTGGVL
jgi:hypothetical protein